MNLANVMQEIADQADMIDGLRPYGYPKKQISPPAFLVSYPRDYVFDGTYGRGMDKMTLQAVLVVGAVDDRTSRDILGEFCDGSGPKSVKQCLEKAKYTAFHTLHVTRIDYDVVSIAGAPYLAAVFSFNITGQGTR